MIQLVAGQNLPWFERRVTAYLDDPSVSVCAVLLGADRLVRSAEDLVDRRRQSRSGVEWLGGPPEGVTIDLGVLEAGVERILVVAGASVHRPVRVQLVALSGEVLAGFEPAAAGSAVVLTEVCRHGDGWKVRAVGQAYPGGLAGVLAAHGLVAADPEPTAASGPERTDEDLLRQHRMILEDASRSAAALEATRDFARRRWEADLERVVADRSLRLGERGDHARHDAQLRHDHMVREAEDRHRADLEHLQGELSAFEDELPAPFARWAQPAWTDWTPPDRRHRGFRVGELARSDAPLFAMPFLLALPMGRPLWIEIDSSDEVATLVLRTAATRVLTATAVALPRVSVIDLGGRRGSLGIPEGLLQGPPAVEAAGARAVLVEVVEHLDLLGTALAAGSLDALDPRHRADRLVLITGFPTGFDEETLRHLVTVIEHGPRLGVHLMVTGAHGEALDPQLLEWLRHHFLRVTSVPGGDLVDGYGGIEWTFLPDAGPADPLVLDEILFRLAASRGDPQSLRRRT